MIFNQFKNWRNLLWKHTTAIPYTLGHEVIATDNGYKTTYSTWMHVNAKIKDVSQAVKEALAEGLLGEDSEVFNYRAEMSNAMNTFTLQFKDNTEQCYEICPNFELEYNASTNEISFPLFFTVQLDGELTKEQARDASNKRLQDIKQLNDIALCIPCYQIGMDDYKRVDLDVVELIHEMDVAAQC